MPRYNVNKGKSSRKFNRGTRKTKAINISPPPMRGGFRL